MMNEDRRVLISGGGPVGLFCALLLGRAGVPVRLFDANPCLQEDPRAATTHPATLEIMGAAGLAEEMERVGLVAPIFQFWDRPAQRLVAEFDNALLKDDTKYPYVVQCEQFKTSKIILDRIQAELTNVEIIFNASVTGFTQDSTGVDLDVTIEGKSQRHRGAWLIGADGGRSTVRKAADIAFEGFTWAERFLVLTTPFDFEAGRGYSYRSYFADPEEWCNCFKVAADGPPGLWRTVFPTDNEASEDSLMNDEAVQARLQKFFPASKPYEVVHRNLYVTHQRVASTFRKGRVLLAGDSAHVNNSIGGMGLNGGLQDADNLARKLAEVVMNGAPDSLLDLYSLQRRTVCVEFVQEQSIANKKRLETREPEARKKNLDELTRMSEDPAKARDFMLRAGMITMQRRAASITLDQA